MKIGTAILLFTCLLGLVLGQNFTAGFLPHLYTGQVTIASTTGLLQADYTQALSRPNVFSATEDVAVATALIDYSAGPLPSGSGPTQVGYAHIEIANPTLTSNKQAFQFNLKTDLTAPVPTNGVKVSIFHVTISFIAIGSSFSGSPAPTQPATQSQNIYARNSDMIQATASPILVPFKHTASGLQSPFQVATGGGGCGAVKKNGKWVIQTVCDRITATVYITGLQFKVPDSSTPPTSLTNQARIGTTPGDKQIDLKSTNAVFNPTSGFGLKIPYVHTRTEKVQFSMVVNAFKTYAATQYPTQATYENDFKANSYLVATINNMQTETTFATTTPGSPFTEAIPLYNYVQFGADKFSDRFCGLSQIKTVQAGTINSGRGIGFDLVNLDLVSRKGQVDPRLDSTTVSNAISTVDGTNSFTYNCLLYVARTPTPTCTQTFVSVDINPTTVKSAVTNTSAATTVTVGSGTAKYTAAVDPYYYLGTTVVLASQQLTDNNTITYTFNILGTPSTAAYQGVLYLTTTAAPVPVNENIKVQVFGNIVVDNTDTIKPTKLFHFSFINANTNNQVVITHTLNQTLASSITQVLEFKLIRHDVVYLTNGTCSNVCAATSGTSVGIDYHYNPPKCIECNLMQNRVFDPANATCKCKAGYVLNPTTNVCQPCAINLCATCTFTSTSNDVCPQCVIGAQLTTVPPSTKLVCKCVAGYFENPNPAFQECVACSPGCATCTSGAACLTCKSPATRNATDKNCSCLAGYFQANQTDCKPCSAPCLTCSASITTCATCNETGNFELSGSTCVCKQGYYSKQVNGSLVCLKCDVTCANCSQDATKCLSCKTDMWDQKADGTCVCKLNLYYYRYANQTTQAFCVNLNCTEISPECVECGVALEPPVPVCKVCDPLKNVVPSADQKACVCKVGYRNTSIGCVACPANCQSCTATACTTCASGSNLVNGVCSACVDGTYSLTTNNVMVCAACNATCLRCTTSLNNCTSCKVGFELTPPSASAPGICVCKTGRYVTPDNNCNACMAGCTSCTNATNCAQCSFNYIATPTPTGTICGVTCGRGFFRADPLCLPCPQGCLACESPYNCTACASGTYLYLGTCVAICPTGTLPYMTGECIACSAACKTCANTPYQCTSCKDGNITYQGQCTSNCPYSTFYSATTGTCQQCVGDCVTCVDTASKCTACVTGKWLFQNQCYSYCPTYLVGTTCSPTCQPGRYFNGSACVACSTTCLTCDAFPACLTCRSGLLYKGTCVASCPANTLQAPGVCYDCDPACIGCSGQTSNCVQCVPGAYRLDTKCLIKCPDTYYPDPSTMTCKKCDADCKICTGPGRCQVCLNGTAAVGGFCGGSCGANCIACTNGVCTTCSPNYYWNGLNCDTYCPQPSTAVNGACVCPSGLILFRASCVASCPSGYYRLNNECKACTSPCATCTTTADICDSCITGYTFDQVNRKCTLNIACEFGKYPSNFGCRFICPENSYYLDSACYDGRCPSGYNADNTLRVCTKIPQGLGCTQPYFLQGDRCVMQCDTGFYPNADTRMCAPCSANCLVCSSALTCASCASGFAPNNGFCVISGEPCPTGLFRSNYGCVATCPYGTFGQDGYCIRRCGSSQYFWNGGCYDTCPTNLRTQDGCVLVCPTGSTAQGNVCVSSTLPTCSAGQFYNSATRQCQNCRYPCASCSGTSVFCLTCVQSFSVSAGTCISDNSCPSGSYPSTGGCQRCPIKCATCVNANTCTSCAPNYVNTGSDCVQSSTPLNNVVLQTASVTKRDSTVFVQIRPSILPNNLPTNLQSQILIFASSLPLDGARVNMWVEGQNIYVAITHPGTIPTYDAVFILNSNVMANLYQSMGYSTSNVFVQTNINQNIPQAPLSLTIPPTAAFSVVVNQKTLSTRLNQKLNNLASKAVAFSQRGY